MKADPADQRLLLELAERDGEVLRLTHRRGHAPEVATLADLEEAMRGYRDETVSAQIAAEDLDREVRRLENEISVLNTRETKDSQLLNGGTMAGKALVELEHEIAGIGRRRGVLEDELLEVMERQEATASQELRSQALVSHTETQIAEATTKVDAVRAEVDSSARVAEAARDKIRAEVDPALLAVYDKQVALGKTGAGLLRQARCGACRMEIDRGTLSKIGKEAPDEVVRCDECGAVLIRTHESGL
ncbi:zinc ribbon domain-containing protein [Williamsia phyllosphaerae]|uniref:C4-type zinc ribbon domain-containing protein n=1 Tax=Williamsia phyllosphaerae TaxID=885042 RepID=A0ABQ1UY26_9NOCA|nr:C4-type zinc ribbon domain-containing protein [Williamsia phyllosphaerae]GGF28959.1 hypothetical protein GCM10007298_26010 [Williamsia phyllosphaerae]